MAQVGEHALIGHQEVGNSFDGVYYVESVFVKQTVQKKDYSDLRLRDRSGARNVKFWGVVAGVEKGSWVYVSASVEEYMGNPSIVAKNMEKVDAPDNLDEYIPAYDDVDGNAAKFDEIRKEISEVVSATGDETIGLVVDDIYGNADFFDRFVGAPGSVKPHYGRRAGLMANTVRIAESCRCMATAYGLSDKERGVLLASALLCRVGAVDAIEFRDCMPVETRRGALLGVRSLSVMRVSRALGRVAVAVSKNGSKVDRDIVDRVLHAVEAHDGKGALPQTREAIVLAEAFSFDSKMVEAMDFIANDQNTAEEFTAWDSAMGRRYYTGVRS